MIRPQMTDQAATIAREHADRERTRMPIDIYALAAPDTDPGSEAIAARLAETAPARADLLRGLPWTERHALARDALPVIAARGDALQYADDGDALDALATAVAVLALQPGGVNAFGWHWCGDHALCVAVEADLAREAAHVG